ncbi:ATP-binding cassette domain-containing protein [Burkholderia mallei]|uniref:SUF system FeS assembly ATPase SufC, internal deletion n=3 Tax=Burkholderia mallei TaxID=13373 RepID=A2SA66_BURM9|nr:ATP-binding cassette domain-containing protein [Burkholderia mallei]AAU49725.1 SUF system FeS assembly ATPase SufC, internal deletion [Burkholderia mallei ATCC 23344]ABM50039.1 SUF system FeS assembly ATPase SufC, internal deletion [Burkholderia mallei SAVP1]ABN02510.1 SUF system FeS assembly ATPase SufC, internal deletion [Burkholderia mallei NCTC 10229]ABO04669.1 SUF system FeS assembly ATPase SufC, internal deletion [Burkholderia mallei NCTC 10247]AIO52003.1 ABC transporter family protei
MNRSEPLLQVFDLSVEVAKRRVLQSVSLAVPAGALVVLMGANGSGKSTLGMTLAGHPAYRATHGHVRFGGQDLLAMSVQERARAVSGGERKRNELLQLALLCPRLAMLDEIDSGMDVDGVRAAVALIGRLREQGTAFVIVSHYLQMIEALVPDTVLLLDRGRIAESGDLALARDIAAKGFARSDALAQA